MRNPIFAFYTAITDQNSLGAVTCDIPNSEHRPVLPCGLLSGGERIVLLDEPQPLIRIRTQSGVLLDLAPSTALALRKDAAGSPMLWRPMQDCPGLRKLHTIRPGDADYDHLRYFVAGLVCGSGQHLMKRFRATFFTAPLKIAAAVEDMVMALGPVMVAQKLVHEYSNRHSAIDVGEGMFYLRSRVLSMLVDDLLTENTQEIKFDLHSTANPSLSHFMRGLISTLSTESDGSILFRHRFADEVLKVADILWTRFGVPCSVSIQDDSRSVTSTRIENRPFLRLSAEQVKYAVAAGLRDGVKDDAYRAKPIPDQIVSVEPLPVPVKCILVAGSVECRNDRIYPLTANTLVFESLYSTPTAMAEDDRPDVDFL